MRALPVWPYGGHMRQNFDWERQNFDWQRQVSWAPEKAEGAGKPTPSR